MHVTEWHESKNINAFFSLFNVIKKKITSTFCLHLHLFFKYKKKLNNTIYKKIFKLRWFF